MTKLCARGKSAAKRKFKVYPSAYANAYASKICAGKIKDPSGTKRKDWGPKKAKEGLSVRPYDPRDKKQKKITDKQNPISEYDPKTKKLKYTAANKGTIMKVANKLEKASKAHAGQAKTLKSLKLSRGGGAAIRGTNFQGVF